MRFSADLDVFLSSTTHPSGTPTAFTSTTSSSSSSESSSESTTFPSSSEESSLAVNRIPMAAIIGGTVGGILILVLATWFQFRRLQSKRRKAELPIQSPSLSSLMGPGDDYLTPVSSILSSVTRIVTDPAKTPFTERRESMTSPVSPAARSSTVMPSESRPESQFSTTSTIV